MVNFLVQKSTKLVNVIHGFTLEGVRTGLFYGCCSQTKLSSP